MAIYLIQPFGLLLIYGIILIHFVSISSESNICGIVHNSFVCCSGYKLDKHGDCTIPICVNGCGRDGQCISPDTCRCASGVIGSSCHEDEYNNNPPYSSTECPNNCNDLGICNNGVCNCQPGYVGDSCQEEQKGECYLNITRGVCIKHSKSLKLSMVHCCGAFGVAWGESCKRCERTRCEKGYIEIDGICQDINECQFPNICQAGKCANIPGSYICQCSSSYRFEPDQADCVQMKKKCEQIPNICGPGMECVSLSMYTHYCKCLTGFIRTQDGRSCVKPSQVRYDLCSSYGSYLCPYGKCLPDGYNYKCECNPGYVSSSDSKSCKKAIDYCTLYSSMICPNGKCVTLQNDYICQCDPGYTASYDRKKCTSICDLYPTSLCPNGQCIPKPNNGYECRCNEGFSATGKGKQCRRMMSDQSIIPVAVSSLSNEDMSSSTNYDTDFCSYTFYSSKCKGGQCVNMKNNYVCKCLPGFVSENNGQSCKNDEVKKTNQMNDATSNVNVRSYCDKYGSFLCTNGRCTESGSSYQCKCNNGYQETSEGKSCLDINECASNPTICAQGTCTNSPGSYQCSCYDGFTIHYVPGGPKCYDRNECEEDKNLCRNGRCINTWGSFKCQCYSGFIVSKKQQHCIPIKDSSDFPIEYRSKEMCKFCNVPCVFVNNTKWKCPCPTGLEPILKTGLCGPLNQVVDIQFDMPTTNEAVRNRNGNDVISIYFELSSSAVSNEFQSRVTSQYNNIVLDSCIPSDKEGQRPGVLCFYHKNI